MSMSEAFSLSYFNNKTLLHKIIKLWGSSLVSGPELNSPPEAKNPGAFRGSATTFQWHHQLKRHEFEQALGDGEGHESLVCCSSWGCKESDMAEQLNNNNKYLQSLKAESYKNYTTWKILGPSTSHSAPTCWAQSLPFSFVYGLYFLCFFLKQQ